MTEKQYDMTYIDAVATEVARGVGDFYDDLEPSDQMLYRIYAVLALSTGENTTLEHVHDAWSAWRAYTMPNHKFIVWFKDLPESVQELDRPYAEAIQAAARVFNGGGK